MSKYNIKSVAFDNLDKPYRGWTIRVRYLNKPNNGDALVDIRRDGEVVREFFYPAYKIFNLSAHFTDIVDGEMEGSTEGYEIAGSDGLGGMVAPRPVGGDA